VGKTMHYHQALVVVGILLLQGCVTRPIIDPEQRAVTVSNISRIYECVWYEYLNGDEATSNLLIDLAVVEGKAGGIRDFEIMTVYGEAREAQKNKVNKLAIEYAQKARPPKIENISGIETVAPNEKETTQALLDLYRLQCESLKKNRKIP